MASKREPPEDVWAQISKEPAADSTALKTQPAPAETYSLFTGQHGSGKSSLMALLQGGGSSGKEDKPKPTVALEYMFARKSNNGAKDVAHIWELGGGMNLQQLVGVPITPARLPSAVLGIVVDLSEPSNALPALAHWIRVLRTHVNKTVDALQEHDPDAAMGLLDAARARLSESHPDRCAQRARAARAPTRPLAPAHTHTLALTRAHAPRAGASSSRSRCRSSSSRTNTICSRTTRGERARARSRRERRTREVCRDRRPCTVGPQLEEEGRVPGAALRRARARRDAHVCQHAREGPPEQRARGLRARARRGVGFP